ncbi:MAG: hypothetical protein AB7O66_08155 [Limisphaerales bacterium]
MNRTSWLLRGIHAAFVAFALHHPGTAKARVVDDFNSGKNGWEDFSFVAALPKPAVDGGQFKFILPPAGQALFIASTKTSETFELKEGRTIEFRVDLVQGGGKDSFAILGFIPTSTGAATLAGYGLAKSTTDVLITKGIGKYFYNENPPEPIKNDDVTLSLTLSVRNGSVIVNARVLDRANNDAVLFEKTVVDTPAADVMADGSDDPAAPFITQGNFVLYLYEDFDAGAPEDPYQATYDNAEAFVTDTAVLDDFNSGKEGWEDFSFVAALPKPEVADGQFKFILPPAGQALFIASTKKSKTYELKEGERLEFRVDLVEGGGKDSFAIVGFIPTSTGAATLAGYGLAKSTTDILVTKGIGKYFYNENPPEPVKNDKITLSLTLTARGGAVTVRARVLDTENDDAVLFEKIVVDTPAADVMADGTDDPAAPFITQGNFVLYLYEDFDAGAPEDPYKATYDNAIVASAPATGNEPPVLAGVSPAAAANFLPVSTAISFTATDDKPIATEALSITLNGTTYTSANGLTVGGSGTSRTASLSGQLALNGTHVALLKVVDSDGATREQTLKFDTFDPANFVVEAEDYNFAAGGFLNNPVPVPEGSGGGDNSYDSQEGVPDIDFFDTRTSPNGEDTMYRPTDPIRMARSLDKIRKKYADAGGIEGGVYDYDVGDLVAGEWTQYTRTFTAGSYEVYLRAQVVNIATADSVLEHVTGDPTQPDAAVSLLGSFLGVRGGFDYQNIPLTDGSGANRTVVRLSGTTTLRIRHLTSNAADGYRLLNYLIFVPVADTTQRATVTSASPAANSTVNTVTPVIDVTLQNRDTTVDIGTVKLRLNGADVPATVTATATGATIRHPISPLPASGALNTARVTFKDNQGEEIVTEWQFTVTYPSLDPAARISGKGRLPGFKVHVVQAPIDGGALENSLDRAEAQLAPNSPIPSAVDTNAVVAVINFNKRDGAVAGAIEGDVMVPGIDPDNTGNGDSDFAVEILTYLDLPAGILRFGFITDDGYKVASSAPPLGPSTIPFAFRNGGTADQTADIVVPQAGLYPFRMVWYERAGSGHAEWTSIDIATGTRILVNGEETSAIRAWTEFDAIEEPVVVESASSAAGPYAADPSAVVDANARTVTVPATGGLRFFRIRSASAVTLKNPRIQGGSLTFGW